MEKNISEEFFLTCSVLGDLPRKFVIQIVSGGDLNNQF